AHGGQRPAADARGRGDRFRVLEHVISCLTCDETAAPRREARGDAAGTTLFPPCPMPPLAVQGPVAPIYATLDIPEEPGESCAPSAGPPCPAAARRSRANGTSAAVTQAIRPKATGSDVRSASQPVTAGARR